MRKLLACVLTVVSMALSAQQTVGKICYTPEEGLAKRFMPNIGLDKQGMIWVGAPYVIQRFNGREFEEYSHLLDNNQYDLKNIHIDQAGRLWLMQFHQTLCWDVQADSLAYAFRGLGNCLRIAETPNGRVFGCVDSSIVRLDDAQHPTWYRASGAVITDVMFQSDSAAWIICNETHLMLVNSHGQTLWEKDLSNLGPEFHLFPGPAGYPLMDITEHLAEYKKPRAKGAFSIEPLEREDNHAFEIVQFSESHGDLEWGFSFYSTLDHYHRFWALRDDLTLYAFGRDASLPPEERWMVLDSIQLFARDDAIVVHEFLVSDDGIAWLATSEGMYSVPLDKAPFQRLFHRASENFYEVGLSARTVNVDDDGIVWVGSWNLGDGETLGSWDPVANLETKHKLDFSVRHIDEINDDNLILISANGDVVDFNLKTLQKHDVAKWGFASNSSILGIARYGEGWLASTGLGGTYFASTSNSGYTQFNPDHRFDISNLVINEIKILDGHVCFASDSGLIVYEADRGFTLLAGNMKSADIRFDVKKPILALDYIDGRYWLSSAGDGIWVVDPEAKATQHITVEDGLGDNYCYGTLVSGDSVCFISTNRGLTRCNLVDSTFYTYLFPQGLTSNEFNRNARAIGPDGQLYFGSINGVTGVDPQIIRPFIKGNKPVIPDYLKLTKRSGETVSYNSGEIQKMDRLLVPGSVESIQLEVLFPDFNRPLANRYSFMLEGHQGNWSLPGKDAIVRYDNLRKGSYTLRARALGANGQWSNREFALPLSVQAPFFRSELFYGLLVVVLGLMAYTYYRNRVNRLVALEKLRTKIASNLHDEVGSKMTRISIYADALSKLGDHPSPGLHQEKAPVESMHKEVLTEINLLSRSVISTMSDVIWSVDARFDRFGDLIARMREFAEEMFELQEVQINFKSNNINRTLELNPVWRQQFFLIYKEAINNISKHALRPTEVHIGVAVAGRQYELVIEDNGAQQETPTGSKRVGQGTSNMKSRAESIGARLDIGFVEQRGFRVQLAGEINRTI